MTIATSPASAKKSKPHSGFSAGAAVKKPAGMVDKIAETLSMKSLYKIVVGESVAIFILILLLVTIRPMLGKHYTYSQIDPEHEATSLTPLSMPNLTESAVKAWAASSVTEIMTIGFGDYNNKLVAQKSRFTPEGWTDFVRDFLGKKVGEAFKRSQLVLTTVPSEDPTIISQGPSETHVYQWIVKVPILMTYATNNEVTSSERATVKLTIVRVPYDEATRGMAIDSWRQ